MNKKQAIINTLMGKIQERSTKLYEDVNDEVWDFGQQEEPKKDYEVSVDGEEVKENEEPEEEEEKVSALDVILDAPVNNNEKEVKEF